MAQRKNSAHVRLLEARVTAPGGLQRTAVQAFGKQPMMVVSLLKVVARTVARWLE